MTYRILALTVAAGVISSAALAKPRCPLGEIYYRSKHACLAVEAAGTTIVRQNARVRLATPAAAIPVPPVRPARIGTTSPPPRNNSIGPIVPPAPETAPRSISPYGALVRVTPIE